MAIGSVDRVATPKGHDPADAARERRADDNRRADARADETRQRNRAEHAARGRKLDVVT